MSVTNITIKGEDHQLRYGLSGCMEFEKRMTENPTTSAINVTIALFYAGLFGESSRKGTIPLSYEEAYDLFEDFSLEKDAPDQSAKMWDCYNKSIHGQDFLRRVDKANKAIEEAEKKKTMKA